MPRALEPQASTRQERLRQGSEARRRRGKLELREQILSAATKLFEANGYEGFSLRQVAEAIGYSPTAIYLHFKDKDSLLLNVAFQGFREFGAAMQAAFLEPNTTSERLVALGLAYLRFGLSHPLHYRLMFMQRAEFLEMEAPEGYDTFVDSFDLLIQAIKLGMESGELKPGDPRALAALLWSAVHGVTSLALSTNHFPRDQAESLFVWHMRVLAREFEP